MRYVTSIERMAKEDGILENARENVIEVLETRFAEVPEQLVAAINSINDPSVLKNLLRRATIGSVAEFQQALDEISS